MRPDDISKLLPSGLVAIGKRLTEIGFERTRRAIAALVLSLFVSLYLIGALNVPGPLVRVLIALAGCYTVAFLAVVAEWFWGRWFASGLAWSGVMVSIASLIMMGWTPALAIYGGMHAVIVLALGGKKMEARYDLQEAWRQRYKMDEFGVARLRKTVTRASASLPSLIIWALAPREEGLALVAAVAALGLAAVGVRGLVRIRSWGVLSLAASCALVGLFGHVTAFAFTPAGGDLGGFPALAELLMTTVPFVLLAAAVLPFTRPVLHFLRRAA
jgi:hypothetical protein